MGAVVYNVDADRGGTVSVVVQVQEADGTAADLTGFTGEMMVRAQLDDETILAEGTVTIDADEGLVTGVIDAGDTAGAEWDLAYYDIRIIDDPVVEYVARGTIRLRGTVTRD